METQPDRGGDTLIGVDIAGCIAGSKWPLRMGQRAAASDVVCLARATLALHEICALAADFLISREAVLDATGSIIVDLAAHEALDDRHDAALLALADRLSAIGLLTLSSLETPSGNAA